MITITLFYFCKKVFILINIWMIGKNSVNLKEKKLGEYHDLYVSCDTLLLADVSENTASRFKKD